MLNKLLERKKVIIVIGVVLLVILGIGAVLFISRDARKPATSLEVIKDGEDPTEDIVDASGYWDETADDDTEDDKGNISEDVTQDTTESVGKTEQVENAGNADKTEQTENNDENNNEETDEEIDEDILEDDITWGDIY